MPVVRKVKVALIGSGAISWTYLQNMTERFGILDVVGCSDIIPERSAGRAREFGIRQMTNEEIWADPEIKIVINTTYPSAHVEITETSLNAGKHVHTEKMMASTYAEAVRLTALAQSKGLRISCAPDTFMGGAYQTARKLIDDGYIGKPVFGHALQVRGYRADGPKPLHRPGGMWVAGSTTPVDMGGYYIHALVHLLGPIARVGGFGQANGQEFTNPKNPQYGEFVEATADTSITAALEFKNGVMGSLTVLGECYGEIPRVEIFGTEGMLICPDPNTYSGPLYLQRHGSNEIMKVPLTHDYNYYNVGEYPDKDRNWPKPFWAESRRGLGVADLAWAITNKRPHRCSVELGLHALEIIYGIEISRKQNIIYKMTTCPAQPEPLSAGFIGGAAEKALDTK
jgi:predicted dehydrogenase